MALRTRLTAYYTCFFAVALLLIGAGLYVGVRMMLERNVERELRAGREQVIEIYRRSVPNLQRIIENGKLQILGEPASLFVNSNLNAQVFALNGELLGRSSDDAIEVPLPAEALDLQVGEEIDVTQGVGKTRVRSLIQPITIQTSGGELLKVGILEINRPLRDIEDTLKVLLFTLLGGGVIALAAAAQGSFWLTRAALEPIDQVARTAQSIVRAEDLGQRVAIPTTQDEIRRLTVTINDLLERLELLFTSQRRFLADVSHELRTPLAAMHGNLEVLARGASRDPALLDESLVDMRRETSRLIRMVNDLLLLAQSDAGVQLRQEPVELDTLLLEVHRELRPLANGVHLRIGTEDQLGVLGDRDRLKQALLNLGINALQHTPCGGTVVLSLERRDDGACLSVRDSGSGISADALPHLWDRFYRADPARTRHSGGAGLGLAIVKWIVESHGGKVHATSVEGQGSTFSIWLPQLPLPSASPPPGSRASENVALPPLPAPISDHSGA
jgi:signal transduction histidine kinase